MIFLTIVLLWYRIQSKITYWLIFSLASDFLGVLLHWHWQFWRIFLSLGLLPQKRVKIMLTVVLKKSIKSFNKPKLSLIIERILDQKLRLWVLVTKKELLIYHLSIISILYVCVVRRKTKKNWNMLYLKSIYFGGGDIVLNSSSWWRSYCNCSDVSILTS